MPDLWVVLPCHNEEHRLNTQAILDFVDSNPDVDVLLVNDASTDSTSTVIRKLASDRSGRIHAIDRDVTRGSKGEAVRAGILGALDLRDSAWVAYLDADLSTPFSELLRLRTTADTEPDRVLIMGARVKLYGRDIQRKWYRHYLGRVFTTAVSLLTGLDAHDTQCGAKLIRSDHARAILKEPFATRWLFDIELILRSIQTVGRNEARGRILEVPLQSWTHTEGSHVAVSDFFVAPAALLKIWWRYR